MTLPTYYNTGAAAVNAGATAVTGTGTGWGADSFGTPVIAAGDFFMDPAQPEVPPQRIASVTDATHLVLARPWPGANVSGPYEVQFVGDIVRSTAQTRRYLERLGQLSALGIQPKGFGDFADRAAFDGEAKGYIFLSLDGDGVTGVWTLYIKRTAGSGDWDAGQPIEGTEGPQGEPGLIGSWAGPWVAGTYPALRGVTHNGTSYLSRVETAQEPPHVDWDVVAAKGEPGPPGADGTGAVSSVNGQIGDVVLPIRERLTSAIFLFVRMDGNDANNGRADNAGGAVQSIQKAVDLAKALDSAGFTVTINVRAGVRTVGAVVNGPLVGGGALDIIGDIATPSNCVVNATSADCFFYTNRARGTVRGFKVTTATSGNCLKAYLGANLTYGNMEFGACAGMHVDMGTEANVLPSFDYAISGGAVGHFHTGAPGSLIAGAITITLTGLPVFSAYFSGTAGGYQALAPITFVGSATGKRFLAHKNGTIDVGTTSLTFLPGDVAGTTESGGKYCGDVTSADIIGNLGATDNALLRADGTGGANAQGSGATLSDNAVLSLSTAAQFNPQVAVNAEYNGSSGGYINFQKGRASGAVSNGDDVGTFVGQARDSGGVLRNVGYFAFSVAAAPAAGSVDGKILFNTTQAGTAFTRMTIGAGILLGTATGGDRGAGTLNATAVYDDNTLLTCMALQRQFLEDGVVDTDFWDSLVPPLEEPEQRSLEQVYETVRVVDVVIDEVPDGLIARRVERDVQAPVLEWVPIWDEAGNGIDAIQRPVREEVTVPAKLIVRRHELAHLFKAMVNEGFDPRDPAQYITKLKNDGALPGMPTRNEWRHNSLSSGEMFNRLWLATEMLAIVVMNLHERLTSLEKH
jgi:hypothetical protein